MKTFDVSRLPPMITLGYDGENNWRPNSFDCSSLLKNHPSGVISLWLLPNGESQAFPVALERDGNTVVWTPLSEEMTAEHGALQIVCTDGTDVGKSDVSFWRVGDSIIPGADHPAAVPSWATQVMEQYQDAIEHYPQIIGSTWHVWDVENETWEDTGVSAQGVDGVDGHSPYIALNGHWMVYSDSAGEWIDTGVSASVDEAVIANAVAAYLDEHPITVTETDPTVPQWAKQPTKPTYTAEEVGALPDSYTPPVQSVNGKTGPVELTAQDVGAEPLKAETVISTNEAQAGKILQPTNRWVLFIRRDNLRSIEFTPLFSGTDDNSTFTWELYATTGGEDADYGSALTTIDSGTANCGDTLVFDKFTRKNAVGIRYVSPIQAFYCVQSAASDATVRVGVKQSGAIKAQDYGCFAGTVKMLLAERDPFITENVFKEKTITFYGDSLTEKNSRYTKGYRDWIVELCEMQSQVNRGVGGYRLWEILRDMNANTDATDCISVMGGVNDGNAWDSEYLGELGDTVAQASDDDTSGTVYGTVYQLCDTLKRKYPTAFILLITPPAEKNPIDGKVSLAEIRQAMIETAELFAIPVYDNFKLSGINTRNKGVFTSDGLHWTDAAHEFIGKNIAKWLLSTFGGIPDLDSTAAGDGAAVGIRAKPHYATEAWVEAQGYLTQHQSLAGYATESYVQTQIANIPDELPSVSASDNGKFLRVVNGAWAAETVPAAEGSAF